MSQKLADTAGARREESTLNREGDAPFSLAEALYRPLLTKFSVVSVDKYLEGPASAPQGRAMKGGFGPEKQ